MLEAWPTSTVTHPAIEGVNCSVTLPAAFEGERTYRVVAPITKGVDTFIIGARGYDEHTAITHDSVVTKADADQFWAGYKAQSGDVIANPPPLRSSGAPPSPAHRRRRPDHRRQPRHQDPVDTDGVTLQQAPSSPSTRTTRRRPRPSIRRSPGGAASSTPHSACATPTPRPRRSERKPTGSGARGLPVLHPA